MTSAALKWQYIHTPSGASLLAGILSWSLWTLQLSSVNVTFFYLPFTFFYLTFYLLLQQLLSPNETHPISWQWKWKLHLLCVTFLKITVGKVQFEIDHTKHLLATPLLLGRKSLREKHYSLSKCGITNTPDDTENGICSKVLGSASTTESIDMFEKTPGDSERQRRLFCSSSWGRKGSHTT